MSPHQMHATECSIGLINWSHLIEDFLDDLDISLERFRTDFLGSWIFGYIQALQCVNVRAVLFCVSARVDRITRFTHEPTGAPVRILPAPRSYRAIRRHLPNPYAETLEQAVGHTSGPKRLILGGVKEIAPYCSTPAFRLAQELRRERCAALVCQEYENPRFDVCVAIAKAINIPVFATFQGGDYHMSGMEKFVRPATLRACEGLIVGASSEANRVRERYAVSNGKVAQIFNPVDTGVWQGLDRREERRSLGIAEDALVAVWHGRVLLKRKGLDVLLEAWRLLCSKHPERDLRLILVGTGNDSAELRTLLSSPHMTCVTWVDRFIDDRRLLRRYLSAADVYVLPSRHEGFPVAPMEAMSCGLPIVGTDASGVPDLLGVGTAGGLVVPRGNARALAAGLEQLLLDDQLRAVVSRKARERAKTCFSLEAVGEQLRAFILREESGRPRNSGPYGTIQKR